MHLIDPRTIAAAGGLNSNVEDLLKWVKLLLNKGEGLIEPSIFNEMIKPQVVSDLICNGLYGLENEIVMESYGLGWILLSYRGHFLAFHGGNINGFSSCVLFLPNENIGIVVLCNKSGSSFPFIVSSILMDQLLDLPNLDWALKYKEISNLNRPAEPYKTRIEHSPSHPISDYLGTFSHPGYGTIELCLINDKLTAIYNKIHLPLNHCNYNVFEVTNEHSLSFLQGIKFTFQENSYGDIQSVSIPWEPKLQGIVFMKKTDLFLSNESYLSKFSGNYTYLGFTVNISHTDNKLIVKVFGQPPYELYPEKSNLFSVKDLAGYKVEFLINDTGDVSAIQMIQPNNTTYTARRI